MPPKKNRFNKDKKNSSIEVIKAKEYIIIIGTTRKESIDYISDVINQKQNSGFDIEQIVIVIVDYFKDSMIRSKYIKGNILRGNKTKSSPIYIFVEFNELDQIIQIEDEYNQSFSYKELSRHYKKQLQVVLNYSNLESNTMAVNNNSKPHKKGGHDFANSTMV
jgi:Zn/Cd-binding protein ZinT